MSIFQLKLMLETGILSPSKTLLYVGTGCKVYYGQGYFTLNTELKSYSLQSNKSIRFSFTFYDN